MTTQLFPQILFGLPTNKPISRQFKMDVFTLANTKYHRFPESVRDPGLVVTIWSLVL
jgi:hypothetical protein